MGKPTIPLADETTWRAWFTVVITTCSLLVTVPFFALLSAQMIEADETGQIPVLGLALIALTIAIAIEAWVHTENDPGLQEPPAQPYVEPTHIDRLMGY